jgi:hypothetical protein
MSTSKFDLGTMLFTTCHTAPVSMSNYVRKQRDRDWFHFKVPDVPKVLLRTADYIDVSDIPTSEPEKHS